MKRLMYLSVFSMSLSVTMLVGLHLSHNFAKAQSASAFVACTAMQPGTGIRAWAITEGGDVWFRNPIPIPAEWSYETTLGTGGGFVSMMSEWTNSGWAVWAMTSSGDVWIRGFDSVWIYETNIGSATTSISDVNGQSTATLRAYPNPTNQGATMAFTLDTPSNVDLRVFDVNGRMIRKVASGAYIAGPHEVNWDGTSDTGQRVAAGTYFYRLVVDGKPMGTKKAVKIQ